VSVRLPASGQGILTYRIVPLHDPTQSGWPVTGYAVTLSGASRTSESAGSVRAARFDTADEARAALAGIPAAHIDDETMERAS
jgi:hypothetical protein